MKVIIWTQSNLNMDFELEEGSGNFFCKGSDGKYFSFVYHIVSVATTQLCGCSSKTILDKMCLCSSKTLFTTTSSSGPYLTRGLRFADPQIEE